MADANVENLRVMAAVLSTQTIQALLEAWRRARRTWLSWTLRSPTKTTACPITLARCIAATKACCGLWKSGPTVRGDDELAAADRRLGRLPRVDPPVPGTSAVYRIEF